MFSLPPLLSDVGYNNPVDQSQAAAGPREAPRIWKAVIHDMTCCWRTHAHIHMGTHTHSDFHFCRNLTSHCILEVSCFFQVRTIRRDVWGHSEAFILITAFLQHAPPDCHPRVSFNWWVINAFQLFCALTFFLSLYQGHMLKTTCNRAFLCCWHLLLWDSGRK